MTCADPTLTVAEVATMTRSLYCTGALARRKLQHLRPYACPFETLLSLVPDTGSLLDIGCGSGLLLGLALRTGKFIQAVGVDISDEAIQMATAMRQSGLNAGQRERLALHLSRSIADWPAAAFDVVSLIDVMHHVRLDIRSEVLEAAIARVKPGGILLYKDMGRRPRWRALLNWLHDLVVSRQWIHYTPIAEIEDAARKSGLAEIRAETINRLVYGHELRVYRKPGPGFADGSFPGQLHEVRGLTV
jgi:2-polyprenyl-3-methyl-5-hydroxy-6-metoxy-1,4-benzoquinol methylase